MSAEQITALINLGGAAAVIIVVVYFLRFIEKRDKDWQAFMTQIMSNKDSSMQELATALKELLIDFRDHNTWERTKIDTMERAVRDIKTRPLEKHDRTDDG